MSHFAAKNVEHFDKRAASYESRMKLDLTKKVVDQGFLKAPGVTWDPESTVVVDFACGTGLVSFNLLPHAKKIIGVDMSQGMLDVYEQKKAAADETASAKLSTMCVDILSMPESEIPSELRGVDVVVCSMAYHHIDDLKQATTVLASLLKKGGHLLVFDLLQNEVSDTFHNHGEPKNQSEQGSGHHHHHHPHHGHGNGHNQHKDDGPIDVKEAVPHIGGMAIEVLESTFKATGILEDISAKPVPFTFEKDGTDFSFVLAQGKRC